MVAKTFEYGITRVRKGLLVSVQLKGPVGPKLKRIELESKLRGVNLVVKLP
jgi:hypothetical protein